MIIMRATLRQGAANTYYGQWLREKAAICGRKSPSIDRNGVAPGMSFAAFGARLRDFPANRDSARGKLKFGPTEKILPETGEGLELFAL
jgi:hypothetical protein